MRTIFGIILLLSTSISCKKVENEQAAIIALLEKESATWRSGDRAAHAACWHMQPYSRILVSTPDGQTLDVPPQYMIDPPGNKMGDGGSAKNANYTFSIHRNFAWVSHDESSTAPDGKITQSWEIRLLEKIDGAWKLVGQSIHIRR
ncbi:MAG: endo-arabinase [Bacteroidetes bacterium]|nr:endo-arabinase [Bacteroidota bacterium]